MKHVYNYDVEDLSALLAADKSSITDETVVASAKIDPDTRNRTILIGLGGTGVKTIHYVKKAISTKFTAGWEKYIAFLALDTAGNELDQMTSLDSLEKLDLTLPGVDIRAMNPDANGNTWRVFADAEKVKSIPNFASQGAGRNRLMGKMKIHDKNLDSAIDETIIKRLSDLKSNVLAPIPVGLPGLEPGQYEVYVVGSVSGGTCSGGFLEMPALIRHALNVSNIHIYAMLYLPDTLISLDSANANELMANGYAALKELNYFQGLHMRDGYSESWTCNDPANPVLAIDSQKSFFELPYLVGTKSGPALDSSNVAMVTIAEFFVSLLGKMTVPVVGKTPFLTDSFLSNAQGRWGIKPIHVGANAEEERPGSAHEFPKNFGAIGFASASAPQEILKVYTIGKACSSAGLVPVSAANRAALSANGIDFLPFLGPEEYMTATAGTQVAQELLKPLTEFLSRYQTQDFDMVAKLDQKPIVWEDVHKGEYDDGVLDEQIRRAAADQTNTAQLEKLDSEIKKAYDQFRQNVQNYLEKDGPFAFVNIYEGHFIQVGSNFGVGIKTMLERLRDGRNPLTGDPWTWQTSAEAKKEADELKSQIKKGGGFFNAVGNVFNGSRRELAASWKEAMDTWANRLINEKQRERVIGKHNALDKCFLGPAAILTEQVRSFGYILGKLSETYQRYGANLNTFAAFQTIQDNPASVNIAALNTHAYAWLKEQADGVAQTIEGKKIREALVKSFFDHPQKWMDFDDSLVKETSFGTVTLANPEVPIPARQTFEACIMENIALNVDVSIANLFNSISVNVSYNTFAQQIIQKLSDSSQVLFHGDIDTNMYHRYIMYPSTLGAVDPAVKAAIENAAQAKWPGIGFYGSDFTDSIIMYQLAVPFEIYRLNDLEQWENNYEVAIKTHNGLHGRSPDSTKTKDSNGTISYKENTSWYDYPSICYRKDPFEKDKNGELIYHEGRVREKIDVLIEEARKLGVMYSQVDADGWYVNRVYCFNPKAWQFDSTLVKADAKTGLMPTGLKFVEEVAAQNKKSMKDISKTVRLLDGGLMNQHHDTEEWAWYYAKRVLYAHRPMLIEIRETVSLFREWSKNLDEYNEELLKELGPGKMIRIMQANLLCEGGDGFWSLDGKIIANLSAAGKKILSMQRPQDAELLEEGFVLYHLYNKLQGQDLDPTLNKAKAAIAAWKGGGALASSMNRTDEMMKTEKAKLDALGGASEDTFANNLKKRGIDPKLAPEICAFYENMKKWKMV